MERFIIGRILSSLVVLLIVSIVVFAALQAAPGDPAALMLGPQAAEPEMQPALEALRVEMGLDQPVYVQYTLWLGNLLRGDFGNSIRNNLPVLPLILGRIPATVELLIVGLIIGVVLAFPGGILSAVKRGTWIDHFISLFAASGIAIPSFWFGLLLILIFSVNMKWLPASGYVSILEDPIGNLQRVILPGLTLGLYLAAYITRFLRADLLEVLNADYIRTARAKGLTEGRVIFVHALKNSLISVLTILGILIGSLLGGVVIIEQVFGWSGVGWLSIQAIAVRDYPMVQGVVLFAAASFILANLAVDLLYGFVDPRVRD
ncbi:MAG: ABC transporter permease [Chloroflexota bacterium]